jgi:alpha-tubulin suppressor-like RCC1 family protein
VRCWGDNFYGNLGYGHRDNIGDNEVPAAAGDVPVGGSVVQLASGQGHVCALLSGGRVRCWGDNTFGQLGYGNTAWVGDNETPASAGDVSVGGSVQQITAGWSHTCALLTTGRVRCWGKGPATGHAQNVGDDELPSSVGEVDVGGSVVQISAGSYSTCALLSTGRVRCWGLNQLGALGYAHSYDIGDDEAPASAGDVPVQ